MKSSQESFLIHSGMVIFEGLRPRPLQRTIRDRERDLQTLIEVRWGRIQENLAHYAKIFHPWGYPLPLVHQVDQIRSRGLPPASPLVQTLLLCEATHGILMGVQDQGFIQGTVSWGHAKTGDSLDGFRGRLYCQSGEPVLKDSLGLLASYFQGPDQRTAVSGRTRSAAFFAFGAPGMAPEQPMEALASVIDMFEGAFEWLRGPFLLEGGECGTPL